MYVCCCLPKGPSTSIVLEAAAFRVATLCLGAGGFINRRVTSFGIDKGAAPIRDALQGDVVNCRVEGVAENAGRRKSSIVPWE